MTSFRSSLALALLCSALGAAAARAQDVDGDGVGDASDNCPSWPNPLQADADHNGIGDACECGDQNADHVVDVRDLIAINQALFDPARATELCDANFDGECDVRDLLAARARVFGGAAHCGRNPPPGFGPSAFVSAPETGTALLVPGDPRMVATDTTTTAPAEQRVVEEGDIYRVLGGGRILNLNAYRGLQVIDVTDVARPRIIGRLAVSGSPVELYVVGNTAFVLLNYWRGYYAKPAERALASHDGAVVLAVDLADPAAPVVRDRAAIPGYVHGSRLTRGGGRAALYLALGQSGVRVENGVSIYEPRTQVRSFEVTSGRLVARPALDLGPAVPSAVQATPEVLLVARNFWENGQRGHVSLVDIRDPGGAVRAGGEVVAQGAVQSQFNMDVYRGVLRVVSSWAGRNAVETWNASDLAKPVPVDQAFFGDNQSLFATLFLGNKAFFVTFLRIDPFHAFAIDDAGRISAHAEFQVSGWNDFFRAVAQETRLIGVGVDDQSSRSAAVSLYDVTDLANPQPLLDRQVVEAASTWSEASFDHRAFSVLEDAVDVAGPPGVRERGLVLLPFTGWNGETYTSAVQIFTFSERTLTRRGLMEHGTPVRRSFLADTALAANLSEEDLALHGLADPDHPQALGSVELAPSYTRLFLYGTHAARVKDSTTYYASWWGSRAALPEASVEIIRRELDPDSAPAVASFRIPAGAAMHQVGRLFVTLDSLQVQAPDGTYGYRTEIAVYDLSDPTRPRLAGTLSTDRLRPGYGPPCVACLDLARVSFAPVPVQTAQSVGVIPGGLVFLQSDDLGRWALEVLDLTRPASPSLAPPIPLAAEGFGFSLLTHGSDAWVSSARSASVDGDAGSYLRYYAQRIDLASPSQPRIARPVNVPGVLVAIEGDDLYTRDSLWRWGRTDADTGVARLRLRSGLAVVLARHVFEGQAVETLLLDGAGQVLVGHRDPAQSYVTLAVVDSLPLRYPSPLRLSVLGALGLDLLSEVEIDYSASLRHAEAGRALLQIADGLLVYNLDDPASPYPQAFFPTSGYPEQIAVDARRILIPAGRYGIYSFDLDAFNLLPPEELSGS